MKDALALALVHFIWQGAVLAIVGAALMRVTRVPAVKYAIGVATMLAMLLAPVMTFLAIQNANSAAPQATPKQGGVMGPNAGASGATDGRTLASVSASPVTSASAEASSAGAIVPTTWILSVWAVGVMVLSLRFVGGWAVARRLATQTLTPVGDELQALAAQMAARLNVRGAVRVCESASVAVPIMIGWLRPVIVLPPAALVALPLAQLEALLAHELAHIRRHDYLVNLLQTGVETLCFYHPAVWWTSREVRRHREQCCDDVAVGVCDRLTYVTALSSLASISMPQFALSATGGSLRDRVRRLIEPTTHSASPKGAWIAMLPILLVVSFVAPHAWGTQATTPVTTTAVVQVDQVRPTVKATTPVEVAVAIPDRLVKARRVERAMPPTPARELRRDTQRSVEAQGRAREAAKATEVRKLSQSAEADLAQLRVEIEHRVKLAQVMNELATTETRLLQEERTLARQRELVEKGLATQSALANAEERVATTRQQLEAAKRHRALTESEVMLRRQEVELARASTAHRNLEMLDSAMPLQPRDQLTITVAGEPDLPSSFTVRADGSIRFPFLGSIRVQDSTTSQVQAAIQKLISDKGLARNPVVTVSAGRMR